MRTNRLMSGLALVLAAVGCGDRELVAPGARSGPGIVARHTESLTPSDGRIVFTATRDGNEEVYSMNPDGSNQVRLTNNAAIDNGPALSPDGTRIAFVSTRTGGFEVFVMDADGSNPVQLTNTGFNNTVTWSPSGTQIAFTSSRDGNQQIYVMNADGSNQTNISNNSELEYSANWSPDGTKIAFSSTAGGTQDIWVMNADGSNRVQLTSESSIEYTPGWSRDGTRIAYSSEQFDGEEEVVIMNADGSNQIRLTSQAGEDFYPRFSLDGSLILFSSVRNGGYDLYTMALDGTGVTRLTFTAGDDYVADWGAAPPPPNSAPIISGLSGVPGGAVQINTSVSITANFSDMDVADTHSGIIDWGDGTQSSTSVTESAGSGGASATHAYTAPGTYVVTAIVSDNHAASDTAVANVSIASTSPTSLWIGLKNSDDVGTYFDILVEAMKNGSVIASGQTNGVYGGSSGFNNAVLRTINTTLSQAPSFASGDVLAVRISARIAVGVTGHRSGTARLWYNDASANSRIQLFVNNAVQTHYLRSASSLNTSVGTGPRANADVTVDRLVNGNAFKPFGVWARTF